MTSLAYHLEDRFSAAASLYRDGVLGRLYKGLACAFAVIGDTLRTLGPNETR